MKILHVVPYFAPAWSYGGTPRAVYELALSQVKQGHEVSVLTTDALDKNQRVVKLIENIGGIKVWRVRNFSNTVAWKLHFSNISSLPKDFKVTSFEVIHLHEARTLLHFLVLRSTLKNQKVFFSAWGTLSYNNQFVTFKKYFDHIFLNPYKNKIDWSFAQTSHELDVYKSFGFGKRHSIVPLGIDGNFYKKLPSQTLARQKLNLKKSAKVYLFLGRFSAAKGLELLCKAFAQFAHNRPEAILILVGRDDGYLSKLRQLIDQLHMTKQIQIRDPLYEKARLTAYRAANWFVFTPIVFEETSTSCLEALACGCPVITTPQAEIPFLTAKDGVKHVQPSISAIVKALNATYSQHYQISQSKILKLFSWETVAAHISKTYEKKQ
jgi:glycosyltransferase involved in cell wall biosynthesis